MYKHLTSLISLVLLVFVAGGVFYGTKVFSDLFGENKELKAALANLQEETQIGYAKVARQERDAEGKLWTTVKFVATSPGDPTNRVLEKSYTIEGDVIHFDCLIVKFPESMVLDGKAKALYLWRRIYGEKMSPSEGYSIEVMNAPSARYQTAFETLSRRNQVEFWDRIWDLADDPDALKDKGIEAIYGNVVYRRVQPGLVYIFKIKATGQVYPEIIPDF